MRINFLYLKSLPVETLSGTPLGNVNDMEIDARTQSILRYYVKTKKLIGSNVLIISPAQIISISEEKIIINDSVENKELEPKPKTYVRHDENPAPINSQLQN